MNLCPKLPITEVARLRKTTVKSIRKEMKKLGLDAKKSRNKIFLTHSSSRKILKINFSPTIFSFQVVKGGVGKTVASFNFAVGSSVLGAKVAVIELDQQANLTRTFGVDSTDKPVMIDLIDPKSNLKLKDCLVPVIDGIDLLPSRVDNALLDNALIVGAHPLDRVFANPLRELKDDYDIVIIDCPPSISASVCAASLASDVIVMPVNPTDYSIAGINLTYSELNALFDRYEKKEVLIKILFNKYDGRTALSFNMMDYLMNHEIYKNILLKSHIRSTQAIENKIMQGKSVFDFARKTNERDDFLALTEILLGLNNG